MTDGVLGMPPPNQHLECFQLMECEETVGAGKTLWPPSLALLKEVTASCERRPPRIWSEEKSILITRDGKHPTQQAWPSPPLLRSAHTLHRVLCALQSHFSGV